MKRVSGMELAILTGSTWRTCKKRMEEAGVKPLTREGTADIYDSAVALAAIYAEPTRKDVLDLSAERARLASAQANKTELEVAELKGEMVRREEITTHWSAMISAMRAKLLSLPSKMANQVATPAKAKEAEAKLREQVHQALEEISNDEFPSIIRARIIRAAEDRGTPSQPAAESVGGRESLPEPGVKRRARKVAD
jgi:phage terminase Nu1 subunit (DNA packaging protein)